MAWYVVDVEEDGVLTNVIVQAASPKEAEKEAYRCVLQETTGSRAPS